MAVYAYRRGRFPVFWHFTDGSSVHEWRLLAREAVRRAAQTPMAAPALAACVLFSFRVIRHLTSTGFVGARTCRVGLLFSFELCNDRPGSRHKLITLQRIAGLKLEAVKAPSGRKIGIEDGKKLQMRSNARRVKQRPFITLPSGSLWRWRREYIGAFMDSTPLWAAGAIRFAGAGNAFCLYATGTSRSQTIGCGNRAVPRNARSRNAFAHKPLDMTAAYQKCV